MDVPLIDLLQEMSVIAAAAQRVSNGVDSKVVGQSAIQEMNKLYFAENRIPATKIVGIARVAILRDIELTLGRRLLNLSPASIANISRAIRLKVLECHR